MLYIISLVLVSCLLLSDCFTQQCSALSSSCLQLLIYMGLGSQPFSLQAILNSCTLGFQDVMKCSGPFGELGRWQYNYNRVKSDVLHGNNLIAS